jgi:hypothetical protein
LISGFLLTSPKVIGLPAAERGDVPAPATSAVIDERWPQIERLLAGDALLFREALTLARRVLYEDLAQVGRNSECDELARAALARCAAWDEELRPFLEGLNANARSRRC